jgi:flagellar basal body rod protein FlgG
MLRALYTAASGMSAQEMNLDNVAPGHLGFRRG